MRRASELVDQLLAQFDVTRERAAEDVDAFLLRLEGAGLLAAGMTRQTKRVIGKIGGAIAAGRGAWWAYWAVRKTRRRLRADGVICFTLAPPPALPASADRGLSLVLRRLQPSCLERALVLQSWLRAHGRDHDVVIGVARTDSEFRAHAWLDVEAPSRGVGFREITRIAP